MGEKQNKIVTGNLLLKQGQNEGGGKRRTGQAWPDSDPTPFSFCLISYKDIYEKNILECLRERFFKKRYNCALREESTPGTIQ